MTDCCHSNTSVIGEDGNKFALSRTMTTGPAGFALTNAPDIDDVKAGDVVLVESPCREWSKKGVVKEIKRYKDGPTCIWFDGHDDGACFGHGGNLEITQVWKPVTGQDAGTGSVRSMSENLEVTDTTEQTGEECKPTPENPTCCQEGKTEGEGSEATA